MLLVTLDGVKVIDVVWMSAGYFRELEAKEPLVLERAPEICVEVLSPSNSKPEMEEKRALYFEAGGKVGVFAYPRKKVQSGISSRLENDPLPLLSILTTTCMSMRLK